MPRNNLYLSPREPVLEARTNLFTRFWFRFFETVAAKIKIIDGAESTSATTGSAGALPAQPAGYFTFIKEDGTLVKVPYYNE